MSWGEGREKGEGVKRSKCQVPIMDEAYLFQEALAKSSLQFKV